MANHQHVEVVKQGKEAIDKWYREHLGECLDLSRADLSRADLRWANLRWADLTGADLSRADLTGADLTGAIIYPGWVITRKKEG